MIKFENTEVFNFDGALRGMRNPMNSWDKSDSKWGTFVEPNGNEDTLFLIGDNDLDLCQRLLKAGPEHAKFMRQIFVSVDITAPLYWWKEFDTYKVGTVSNSCSTMHKIHSKEFTIDDFSHEHLCEEPQGWIEDKDCQKWCCADELLEIIVNTLNAYINKFLITNNKKYWWQMIQLLPSSYNQKRTITLNYANLRNMYFQRKNHKLDEWSIGFCSWVKSLPYAEELICYEG